MLQAASTVKYTVSGSVSYTAQVACTWEVTAVYGDASTTNAAQSPSETGKKVFVATDTAGEGTWDADMVFGAEEGRDTIILTIKCTNDGTQPIKIGLVSDAVIPTGSNLTVTMNDGDTVTGAELKAATYSESVTDTYTLTVTFKLNSKTAPLPALDFSFPFKAEAVQA